MALKPNASQDELSSPYFVENERVCKEFEAFVKSYNGLISGKYNAFSYYVKGKINKPSEWLVEIEKATYTSGNLLLSTEYQNLKVRSNWKSLYESKDLDDFEIRQKRKRYLLGNSSFEELSFSDYYESNWLYTKHKDYQHLLSLFKPLIKYNHVSYIKLENGVLEIELNSKELHLDVWATVIEKGTKHNNG